jgi:thiamine-phosphate pyrophosphorylase
VSSEQHLEAKPSHPRQSGAFVLPRFYPILDTEACARCGMKPAEAASELLEAGVRILQFRHKGFFSRQIFAEIEQIANLCAQAKAIFVVNDRADLAAILGAALHLGQDDLTPSAARLVTGERTLIGYSTHNEQQLREADLEPADYLAIGPIFSTGSKQNPDPVVGIPHLAKLRAITNKPLVAIGGIALANAASAFDAGADSVAVIGDIFAAGTSLRSRAEQWLSITR